VANWTLSQMLGEARDVLGLERTLITCAEGNSASARMVEHCGGILDEIRATGTGPQRRYLITSRNHGTGGLVAGKRDTELEKTATGGR